MIAIHRTDTYRGIYTWYSQVLLSYIQVLQLAGFITWSQLRTLLRVVSEALHLIVGVVAQLLQSSTVTKSKPYGDKVTWAKLSTTASKCPFFSYGIQTDTDSFTPRGSISLRRLQS